MIFRQEVLKEEKIKFVITAISVFLPYAIITILSFIYKDDVRLLFEFLLVCFFPTYLLVILLCINNLEWYDVFDDRIEVRCAYGIKNKVYYDNVLSIQEVEINLTARGMKKKFYIFNDGRKKNRNIFNEESCYNKKRNNLIIYKTSKLENYIVDILKNKTVKKDLFL